MAGLQGMMNDAVRGMNTRNFPALVVPVLVAIAFIGLVRK